MAKVTESCAGKQGPNGLETGWDSEEVAETAQAIEGIAAIWKPQKRDIQTLRALCDLVKAQPDRLAPGVEPDHWGFDATEIGDRLHERFHVSGAVGWKTENGGLSEKGSRNMRKYWQELEATWAREHPSIADGLAGCGHRLRLRPHGEQGGGQGNRNRYGFKVDSDDREDSGSMAEQTMRDIDLLQVPPVRYRLQDISGNRLARWMSKRGFYLGGWGGKIFRIVSGLVLVAAVVLFLLVIWAMGSTVSALAFLKLVLFGGLMIFVVHWWFAWLFRLGANRVAVAPKALQPWPGDDCLLELRKQDDDERNSIYLVRYAADCPICGDHGKDKIHVASGRWKFFGRLVGRCDRAPNAHVFSFDHISRTGRFLR